MRILIIGSGGREHAMAWKIAQSPKLTKLYIAPGNAGTASVGENVDIDVSDHLAVSHFCKDVQIDLVLVGPETPLAEGIVDALFAYGIQCFGPCKAAAQIESSKAFAKDFMLRHHIPTASYATFTDFEKAIAHLHVVDYPIVIKASGLAAGKGVLLPENNAEAVSMIRRVMVEHEFGLAGDTVVIEERMNGPEVTLLAFSDGKTVKPMLPSQDHKRVFDGDLGPNTGGMGAYAPVPICPPEMVNELVRLALQPCIDGLRAEGMPFVGVLYGGFMLTDSGPRVIEFNCRFGDPEAQVILPLLETDLIEIAMSCVDGKLTETDLNWKDGAASCVVLASGGYPGQYDIEIPIDNFGDEMENAFLFHAATKFAGGRIVSAGGRVLCVTGCGANLQAALSIAYARIEKIRFEKMHYRKDIGWQVSSSTNEKK